MIRRAALLILLCATAAFGQMPMGGITGPASGGSGIAVTCALGSGSFSGTSATVSIAAPNGSLVVVGVGTILNANFTSLKDNLGNNLTADTTTWVNSDVKMFHEVSTGITGVTATFAAGTNQISVEACYATGLTTNAADVIDQTGHSSAGAAATFTSGAMTTTNASDVVFGFVYAASNTTTVAATSPWLLGDTHSTAGSYSAAIVYQIVAATGTYTPAGTLTPSQSYTAIGGSYK